MIVYDSKKWNSLFKTIGRTYKESYNQQQLVKFICVNGLYATVVTMFNMHFLEDKLTIDTMFFSMLAFILSLFLVFRLNSAYDRWWEGRKAWGSLINNSRSLSMLLNAIIPTTDKSTRKFFAIHISNFTIALQWHLRSEVTKTLDNMIYTNARTVAEMEKMQHIPNAIVSKMHLKINELNEKEYVSEMEKMQLRNILEKLIDILGICERIKKTPIPFSHGTFIKLFILIYIFILPFGLVQAFEYLTIPAAMIMSFAMMGIELISEEIEDPFGMEANNLPTGSMSDTIRDNVYEIMGIKSIHVPEGLSKSGVLH
ncbi:MAG: hypothetical protein HRT72_11135 [Flavobacteriales bacterium]|nr:hypothetical protein [Flavobacteriales bacterium]